MKKNTKSEQIIKQIEELLMQLKESLNMSNKISSWPTGNLERGFSGLTGEIHELIKEGFFNEPKTISDLQRKLKDRSIKKPTTALMPSLKRLIIKKVLDRNKPDKGLYNYFKR